MRCAITRSNWPSSAAWAPTRSSPWSRSSTTRSCSSAHRHSDVAGCGPRDLDNLLWIHREEGSATRVALNAALQAIGAAPRRRLALPSWEAIKLVVAQGDAVAAVSRLAIAVEQAAGTLAEVHVRGWRLGRPISLAWHPDLPLSPVAAGLHRAASPGGRRGHATVAQAETRSRQASRRGNCEMSRNKATVETYIDGFNKSDHAQILSCLTDDIDWTVLGFFRLHGKEAYDREIENPAFTGSPIITITRMVEEDDVVMAEMTLEARRASGEMMRAAMSEVFVMREGKITERRAYVIELKENDYR